MLQPIVPTAVPIKLISTITTMNNSNPTTQTNNTLSLSNGMDGPTSSRFDIYQQNKIGSNEVSIRTLVPASISIENYRKALNAKICFRNILTLFITPSVSSSDFMTTVASYFRINMGSSERKVEGVVDSIRKDFCAGRQIYQFVWESNSSPRFNSSPYEIHLFYFSLCTFWCRQSRPR